MCLSEEEGSGGDGGEVEGVGGVSGGVGGDLERRGNNGPRLELSSYKFSVLLSEKRNPKTQVQNRYLGHPTAQIE